MNVSQATIKDILNNQEFSDIMASIGLVIGQPIDDKSLRYSKIVFLADSDVDGGHINTLLTNFFYSFWPEMFELGMIYLAKAPLFEVVTNKDVLYFESEKELELFKSKNLKSIKQVHRNKGLGEMSPQAWKYIMNRDSYTKIEAPDSNDAKEMLNICFGKDSSLRKELLIDQESPDEGPIKVSKTTKNTKAPKKVVKKKRVLPS